MLGEGSKLRASRDFVLHFLQGEFLKCFHLQTNRPTTKGSGPDRWRYWDFYEFLTIFQSHWTDGWEIIKAICKSLARITLGYRGPWLDSNVALATIYNHCLYQVYVSKVNTSWTQIMEQVNTFITQFNIFFQLRYEGINVIRDSCSRLKSALLARDNFSNLHIYKQLIIRQYIANHTFLMSSNDNYMFTKYLNKTAFHYTRGSLKRLLIMQMLWLYTLSLFLVRFCQCECLEYLLKFRRSHCWKGIELL